MDLYIGGLAPQTTQKSFKRFLRPKLKSLGIESFNCSRYKGKRYGFVTIPFEAPAKQFLQKYAVPGSLKLVHPLTVKISNRQIDSREFEALRHRQKETIKHEQSSRLPVDRAKRKFTVEYWSCGRMDYRENDLVIFEEYSSREPALVIFGRKSLTLSSPANAPVSVIEIEYSSIESVYTKRLPVQALTMNLHYSPKVTRLRQMSDLAPNMKAGHGGLALGVNAPMPSSSVSDLLALMGNLQSPSDSSTETQPSRVRGVDSQHADVLASAFTYHIVIDANFRLDFNHYWKRSRNMPSGIPLDLPLVAVPDSFTVQLTKLCKFLSSVSSSLSFSTKFQIQRLAQNRYLPVSTVTELAQALKSHPPDKDPAPALRKLARNLPVPSPDTVAYDFCLETLLSQINDDASQRTDFQPRIGKRQIDFFSVHQAFVTPAGVYLEGPELFPPNRVLREYGPYVNSHFLRVVFMDEDGGDIRFDRPNSMQEIHSDWFQREILDKHIDIAGQNFKFLGFSNSSLREQACWFMADFRRNGESLNSWKVVQSLGDFSEILSPARYAARIGQAFSDTQGGVISMRECGRTEVQIREVERDGRKFSDGCGTVSEELLQVMRKTFRRGDSSTCFQIRYGGAKGMVSLDPRLSGSTLCIRPSMLKFKGAHTDIEICAAAHRPLPFFLNRQIIKILEDHGVQPTVFMDLQAENIANLRQKARSATAAADFLDRHNVGKGCNLSWYIEKLDQLGLPCLEDRFLNRCIEHTVLVQLRMIKHKARIFVENAHTLFGIMDETDILKEGQVLCRIGKKSRTGPAAITRSPALHPGDIQLVEAVDVDEESPLSRLDNCIVFSQKGTRDLPSQLGGGDLDGDLYNIIFDENLIPKNVTVPADYPSVSPRELTRHVELQDITAWFVRFMRNDQLPYIAILHMRFADYETMGTRSEKCIQLAELHSSAVDFQKSGLPVERGTIPVPPKTKPDFMAPNPRLLRSEDEESYGRFQNEDYVPSDDDEAPDSAIDPDAKRIRALFYPSQKVLGELYRAIDEDAFQRQFEAATHGNGNIGVTQALLGWIKEEFRGFEWEHLTEWAWEIRDEYEEIVAEYMVDYSPFPRQPLLEDEVFTGEILGKTGSLPSRRIREQSRTLKDRFNEDLVYMRQRITHRGWSENEQDDLAENGDTLSSFGSVSGMSAPHDEAMERSIACLAVSLEKGVYRKSVRRCLESFKYVAGSVTLREREIFMRHHAIHPPR